jgi:hypothetical protein
MAVTRSSETSDNVHRITRRYTPIDTSFHKDRCENFKSYRNVILQDIYATNEERWLEDYEHTTQKPENDRHVFS